MQSKARNVDEYLKEVPEDRREALAQIRALCLSVLVGYEECMAYGMPSYRRVSGEVEVAFASQKQYISLYILKPTVLDKYRSDLAHLDLGKGCIRYRKPQQIKLSMVAKLLEESRHSDTDIC